MGHHIGVDDRSWNWVGQSVGVLAVEETLRDSLVDQANHHFDWKLLCRCGFDIVNLTDCSLKLRKFIKENGLAL